MTIPLAEIVFEHVAPGWLIVAALVVGVLLTLLWFVRYLPILVGSIALAVIRVAFLLLLGWCLLMPLLKRSETEAVSARFVVAVDTSSSMALSPQKEGTNRWAAAQGVLRLPWTHSLPGDPQVDIYPFAADVGQQISLDEATRLAPDAKATHLHAALRKVVDRYKGQNLAGLLLLSDGLDTQDESDDWAAEQWPCPIFTVRLEPALTWETEPDVHVETVNTPRRVVVGWDTKLTAVVSGQGLKGQSLNVQLLENDRVVREVPAQIAADASREVPFLLSHPAVGSFRYTVRIPPLAGETHTNDNAFDVTVQVVDAKNRLLYVEGVPRWESKYLLRVLRANKNISPLSFLRGPGNHFLTYGERESMSLDLSDDQLTRFKIVILGDLDAEALTPARAQSLVKYVESGGSLVFLGGPIAWGPNGYDATDLRKIMPVKRDNKEPPIQGTFALELTDEGRAHPAFADTSNAWSRIPPVLSIFAGATLPSGAVDLLTAQVAEGRQPLLVAQRYGQGKVVAILTDSLWRWQLDPGPGKLYAQFWNQILQWLSPSETEVAPYQMDLAADSDQVFMGEHVILHARLSGTATNAMDKATVVCEVETPEGRKIPLTMNRQNVTTTSGKALPDYRADYLPEAAGLHRTIAKAQVGSVAVESSPYSFFVKPYTPESNPRPANIALLKTLSASSGGKFCEPEELSEALAALPVNRREESRVLFRTLWNTPLILACLVGLLGLDWIVRKSRNMA
jgi:hypothetical protein